MSRYQTNFAVSYVALNYVVTYAGGLYPQEMYSSASFSPIVGPGPSEISFYNPNNFQFTNYLFNRCTSPAAGSAAALVTAILALVPVVVDNNVKLTGNQTISGTKTFNNALSVVGQTQPLGIILPGGGSAGFTFTDSGSTYSTTVPASNGTVVLDNNTATLSNKTLTGVPSLTFTTGVALTTYDEVSFSLSYQGPWLSSFSANFRAVKVGKMVTLYLPNAISPGQIGGVAISTTAPLPVGLRPANTAYVLTKIINGAVDQATAGLLNIFTDGTMSAYSNLQGTAFWTTLAGNSGFYANSVSYVTN